MTLNRQSLLSLVKPKIDHSFEIAFAFAFWFILIIIGIVAAAQSEKRWDTIIAALAMGSQAFFAAAVWKLGRNQFSYTKQVAERQHKIDMYPLRKVVLLEIERVSKSLAGIHTLSDEKVEAFRQCHLEINKLFSDEADGIAFELSQAVARGRDLYEQANQIYDPLLGKVSYLDQDKACLADEELKVARDLLVDLQNIIDEEMRLT